MVLSEMKSLKKSFDRAWIYREKYGDCDITSRDK